MALESQPLNLFMIRTIEASIFCLWFSDLTNFFFLFICSPLKKRRADTDEVSIGHPPTHRFICLQAGLDTGSVPLERYGNQRIALLPACPSTPPKTNLVRGAVAARGDEPRFIGDPKTSQAPTIRHLDIYPRLLLPFSGTRLNLPGLVQRSSTCIPLGS